MRFRLRTLMNSRLTRFSLRTFFIALTPICCVLAYGASWSRQRKLFLEEQANNCRRLIHGSYLGPSIRCGTPPFLLKLVGAKGYSNLEIFLRERDTFGPDKRLVLTTHPAFVRAKRLFPEAMVSPVVETSHSGLLPVFSVKLSDFNKEEQRILGKEWLDLMPRSLRKRALSHTAQ